MDDSCRRPGSIPFKWEICPGTPKHTRSASAASSKVAPKLTPPPFMASPSPSPSPYHSPRVSYSARSASVSPSRRRCCGHRRPTAFLELAPRTTTDAKPEAHEAAAAAAYRCFPLPMLIRRRDSKKGGSGSASSSRSSGSSFRSDGGQLGLQRSASSSFSSLPLPPGRRFAEAREEVEAATGWFF